MQFLRHQFISDAVRTILKEEGWSALYKGLVPGLFLVKYFSSGYLFSLLLPYLV